MSGHADPGQRKADTPCHFHIHNRERDGNSETAVEHIVQERIARVVIVFAVAAEVDFFKQHAVQCRESRLRIRVRDQRCDTAR